MVDRTEGLRYNIGNAYHDIDAEAARDRLDGYAVVSGLTPTVGTGLEVSIASGEAIVGTDGSGNIQTTTPGSSTSVSLGAADSTFPRKDVIHIDSTGTVAVTSGTAEEALPGSDDPGGPATRFDTIQPEPPEYPTDVTVLAEVWVPAGATSLSSADVRDRRQPAEIVGDTIRGQLGTSGARDDAFLAAADAESVTTTKFDSDIEDPNDVSLSRSFETTYQNTTGYELLVNVIIESDGSQDIFARILTGSSSSLDLSDIVGRSRINSADISAGTQVTLSAVVEAGDYYLVENAGASTISDWVERGRV